VSGGFVRISVALAIAFRIALGATGPADDSKAQNIDEYVALLRHDIRTQKVAITSQLMDLTPEQAAVFWPIYKDYSKELDRLGDLRVRGIREYGENYSSMTNDKAAQLAAMRIQFEEKMTALKKSYFGKFSKALNPKLAARFLQIENQLLDILDLQIASSLPIIE